MTVLHIVVAMKPVEGNYATNALESGVAGINIDGCRIGTGTGKPKPEYKPNARNKVYNDNMGGGDWENTNGRWPANVAHDGSEEIKESFPDVKTGNVGSYKRKNTNGYSGSMPEMNTVFHKGDSGSAARFFKECKA